MYLTYNYIIVFLILFFKNIKIGLNPIFIFLKNIQLTALLSLFALFLGSY